MCVYMSTSCDVVGDTDCWVLYIDTQELNEIVDDDDGDEVKEE